MSRFRVLLFHLRYAWHLPTLLAVTLMLFLVAMLSRDPLDLRQGSGKVVEARITRLSSLGNRYQGRWPGLHVIARTEDGTVGVTTALPVDLKGCKVGDRIEARRRGLKLYLKPRPCP